MADLTQVEFTDFQLPGMESGQYILNLTQHFSVANPPQGTGPDLTFTENREITVKGQRFALQPSQVRGVFPPKNGNGIYSNVLPHLMLNAITLPWQRLPQASSFNAKSLVQYPWLALLVFDEDQTPEYSTVKAGALTSASTTSPYWPGLSLDLTESIDQMVGVIDVPASVVSAILPAYTDLPYLAHTRQVLSAAPTSPPEANPPMTEQAFATIVANRLPNPNGKSTVHLVSLEDRYSQGTFNQHGAAGEEKIRLVSLHHWSFTSQEEIHDFDSMMKGLNTTPSTLQKSAVNNTQVDPILAQGKIPLPHALRTGDKAVSWYQGPLVPIAQVTNLPLPATASDGLLQFYQELGMFQVGYAAAWELGRLLMLRQKRMATAWFSWKLENQRKENLAKTQAANPHLMLEGTVVTTSPPAQGDEIPEVVTNFFQQLAFLQHVPFYYLVPEEGLLPTESIRFFQVDPSWLDALLDGAAAVGGVPGQGITPAPAVAQRPVSGFLLRSAVISDFPHLEINAQTAAQAASTKVSVTQDSITPIYRANLSPNVMLCFFDEQIVNVDLHLKPEALHFGFDEAGASFSKTILDYSGAGDPTTQGTLSTIPMRGDAQTIDIANLAGAIKGVIDPSATEVLSSSQFALHMIEGVGSVRFKW